MILAKMKTFWRTNTSAPLVRASTIRAAKDATATHAPSAIKMATSSEMENAVRVRKAADIVLSEHAHLATVGGIWDCQVDALRHDYTTKLNRIKIKEKLEIINLIYLKKIKYYNCFSILHFIII